MTATNEYLGQLSSGLHVFEQSPSEHVATLHAEQRQRNGHQYADPYSDVPPPDAPPPHDSIADATAFTPELVTVNLSTVEPETARWVWPGYLPLGKLTVLDGDPEVSKSTLSLEMGSTVTTGGEWPDGSACDYPGDVILFSAEDGLADTVRPRIDAAGGNPARFHAVRAITVDDKGTKRMPTMDDVAPLRRLIERTGARLVITDVLMAYLPTATNSYRDQDVRHVLGPLAELAEGTDCAVLLLRHLNKGKDSKVLYRGGGSIGIVGAARVELLIAHDPDSDDESRRVLAQPKNNLAPHAPSLSYRLVGADNGAARIEWTGTSDHDARALLADDGIEASTAVDEAKDWLEDYLAEQGRCPSADAKTEGRKAGFSERTIKRAASKLRVVSEPGGFPRRTYWSLPTADSGASPICGPTGPTERDQPKHIGPVAQRDQSGQSGQRSGNGPTDGADPACIFCGRPVMAGQGDSHLSCREGE